MTSRNLNGNWIDTLRRQYVYDLNDDCAHPITYLLWNPQKTKDLYYLIPAKIEEQQLRRSLVKYHRATKGTSTVDWENEHVKVYQHPRYHTDADHTHDQVHEEDPTDDDPPAQGIPTSPQ
ncbi:hypothetical protein LTR36_004121 [Oleoguttula mirabilis]|uniref:Uncharacterized protein n=1 Tax=Oleoguttula mirabilis TaxID=1507867 RepID=A0AAV9JH65_9PEZI|nr:hypothetical protein LTR36_004121 [Oleoguttula mirabilis]